MRKLVAVVALLGLASGCDGPVEKRAKLFVAAAQAEASGRLALLRGGDPCKGVSRSVITPGRGLQPNVEEPADIRPLHKASDDAWRGATESMAEPELAAALNEVHKALLALRNNHGALMDACFDDPAGNAVQLFRRQMGETGGWLEKKVEEAEDAL